MSQGHSQDARAWLARASEAKTDLQHLKGSIIHIPLIVWGTIVFHLDSATRETLRRLMQIPLPGEAQAPLTRSTQRSLCDLVHL